MRRFLLMIGVLSVLALYMLAVATGYAAKMSEYFWYITAFAVVLTLALVVVLAQQLWQLRRDAKRHVFGAKLSRRLVNMFTWVAILPGVFVFAVSAQFITHSINSWFGNETAEALERSLNLSKLTLNATLQDSLRQAQNFSHSVIIVLSERDDVQAAFDRLDTSAFAQVLLYRPADQKLLAQSARNDPQLPLPAEIDFPSAAAGNALHGNVSINNTLYAQIWLPIHAGGQDYLVFFRQSVPPNVAADVTLIENARAKYAELSFAKRGLQTFFLMTLLLATLLAVMLAILAAVFFARRFVAPLQSLAQATQSVAQGDYSRRSPIYRSDELGMLSARFNRMTEQLQTAREATDHLHKQQEAARRHLELILASLSAGVLTLDDAGCLKAYNDSAAKILDFPLHELIGIPTTQWHGTGTRQNLIARFVQTVLDTAPQDKPIESEYGGGDTVRILLGKAAQLPDGADTVLVFDDVTDLVSAQKEAAWGEVARRLAHEIRNPLTPIQLSAERLAWKLQGKLDDADADILHRATDTIVKQVAALQEMVEGFRNYARSANLRLHKTDLNEIVAEVLVLYEGSSDCRFNAYLHEGRLPVKADNTALRQVLHNIFKNAAEAAAADHTPQVTVTTESDGQHALLTVCNNGLSFTPEVLRQAFEPYVTDKKNGTGLGLAVVKKIIDEHSGTIILSNQDAGGARIKITLPLTEK
ncbi:MAG: ATP-binding protein [Neisseria sp.]|nr:ATP-binding protein [Neisseria sp.]